MQNLREGADEQKVWDLETRWDLAEATTVTISWESDLCLAAVRALWKYMEIPTDSHLIPGR
jgi:hypothetical protein